MDIYNNSRLIAPNQKVLEIIQSAWEGERESESYLHKMVKLAKSPLDKETLRLLYMDEHKHIRYFADIFMRLSGRTVPQNIQVSQRPISWDFYSECEKMMYKFTENTEFYRRIYFGFNDMDIRDMLFEIITDEMNMAVKMTHICNKNREFF